MGVRVYPELPKTLRVTLSLKFVVFLFFLALWSGIDVAQIPVLL